MCVDKKSHQGLLYSGQRRLVWVDIFEKTFNWSKDLTYQPHDNEHGHQNSTDLNVNVNVKNVSLDNVLKCNYVHSTEDLNVPSCIVNITIQTQPNSNTNTNTNHKVELDSMQIICDSITEGSDLYNAVMFTKGIKKLDRTTI